MRLKVATGVKIFHQNELLPRLRRGKNDILVPGMKVWGQYGRYKKEYLATLVQYHENGGFWEINWDDGDMNDRFKKEEEIRLVHGVNL